MDPTAVEEEMEEGSGGGDGEERCGGPGIQLNRMSSAGQEPEPQQSPDRRGNGSGALQQPHDDPSPVWQQTSLRTSPVEAACGEALVSEVCYQCLGDWGAGGLGPNPCWLNYGRTASVICVSGTVWKDLGGQLHVSPWKVTSQM